MASNKDDSIIDIRDILHALYKWRYLIIITAFIGLLSGIAMSIVQYTRAELAKDYTITSSFAVTSTTEDGLFTTRTYVPNSTDIRLAADMVDSVIYVMKSDKTLNAAIDELQLLGITAQDIKTNLTLKKYNETQIVEMSLGWNVAEEGIQILNALNRVAPQILIDTLKIGSVTVVNEPKSQFRPPATVSIKTWVIFTMLGAFAGMAFAVLKMLLQPTVVRVEDIEEKCDLEVIGQIPYDKQYFAQDYLSTGKDKQGENHFVREYFISASHVLRHRLSNEKPASVYVTSAAPDEGKTSVLANLAVELSNLEYKVLMIDFDVHNPSLGTHFLTEVDYYHSLNALYRGETKAEEAVVHIKSCLDLLPIYLEHKALVLNDELMDAIRGLSGHYDYVLMDSSPVGCSADTLNLNKLTNRAILVTRHDTTRLSEVTEALKRLDKSGTVVIGAIINAMTKPGNVSYHHYYHRQEGKESSGRATTADHKEGISGRYFGDNPNQYEGRNEQQKDN